MAVRSERTATKLRHTTHLTTTSHRGELTRPDGRRMPVAVETIPWTGSAQALEAMLRETKVARVRMHPCPQPPRPPILWHGLPPLLSTGHLQVTVRAP